QDPHVLRPRRRPDDDGRFQPDRRPRRRRPDRRLPPPALRRGGRARILKQRYTTMNHRDTENTEIHTEKKQAKLARVVPIRSFPCLLCVLCVSSVSLWFLP